MTPVVLSTNEVNALIRLLNRELNSEQALDKLNTYKAVLDKLKGEKTEQAAYRLIDDRVFWLNPDNLLAITDKQKRTSATTTYPKFSIRCESYVQLVNTKIRLEQERAK